ncbi:hypothetical protein ACGFMM_34215 [Streptomyces sp. NPDC048604]|uniref:hypothetical protein n=1 Tax=Streptomyces sp. NPDC048604 TaxID=3365578 RepID=UPI00372236AA
MSRVRLERNPDGQGEGEWRLRLTSPQADLLRRTAEVFFALVQEGAGRELALGPGGAELPGLMAATARTADADGLVHVSVTAGQLHAVHSMLMTLLVLVPSELAFMQQVGHFREQAAALAAGLRRAALGLWAHDFGGSCP